jgi:hypothetical protein
MLSIGPVLAIDDAIGLKVRALHDRTTHRDFIDVHAATIAGYTPGDLERLGRREAGQLQPLSGEPQLVADPDVGRARVDGQGGQGGPGHRQPRQQRAQ